METFLTKLFPANAILLDSSPTLRNKSRNDFVSGIETFIPLDSQDRGKPAPIHKLKPIRALRDYQVRETKSHPLASSFTARLRSLLGQSSVLRGGYPNFHSGDRVASL